MNYNLFFWRMSNYKLFLIFFLFALRVGSEELNDNLSASGGLSDNEFFIEQLDGKNFLESDNTFFLLSVTGGIPDSSSTGTARVNIDTTKPSLIGSFTFTTDKEIDQNILVQDLSIITGVPQERFNIISIAYLQINQAIKFSTLSFIKKILIQFEILPITDDSGLTPGEIFQKLKISSGISTTYLSNIASDTFLEKCSDNQFKTDCTPSKDTNYILIIPTTISGLIILLTTVLCIYKYKKKPNKNIVYKIERNHQSDIVQSLGEDGENNTTHIVLSSGGTSDNLIKTFPEEKDTPPVPVINGYVSQQLEPVRDYNSQSPGDINNNSASRGIIDITSTPEELNDIASASGGLNDINRLRQLGELPLEDSHNDYQLTVHHFPVYNQPDKTKKKLNSILPNKRNNLTLNEFPSFSFSNISKKIKRNTHKLVPLEIPKFPVINEESSEESDLSSEYSSSEYSSSEYSSSTPNLSSENSYSNSISYRVSVSKSKKNLASIKPVK